MGNNYTYIDEAEVWVCDDCGAHAENKEDVKHHKSCIPGESKKWENIYGEVGDESWIVLKDKWDTDEHLVYGPYRKEKADEVREGLLKEILKIAGDDVPEVDKHSNEEWCVDDYSLIVAKCQEWEGDESL